MNASAIRDTLDLPIEGMTCAACAARIEKQLNKLPGVSAAVNFASERAHIAFDAGVVSEPKLVETIEKAGFKVPPQSLDLAISGMTCAACATRIETVLNKLPGVAANVNFATEKANIRYVPGLADAGAMIAAVRRAGYEAREATSDSRAADKARKAAAYQAELKRFWISVALTLPLVAQMGAMFTGEHQDVLPRWLQFALATPVQFWIGWRFYVGAYHALRGGAGNMDVLVALGTSMAWAFSAVVTVAGLHHHHVYFEASAAVITLVLMGKLLEARAKAKTSAAIEALIRLQPQTARVAARRRAGRSGGGQPESRRRLRRAAGRERAGRRRGGRGRLQRERGHAHRREPARRQRRRRQGVCRHGERRRLAQLSRHRCRQPHAARRHHPHGRAGAGLQGASAAPRRPHLGDLRAGGDGHRVRRLCRLVVLRRRFHRCAGECRRRAGDRLSLRARAGDADGDHGRHRARRRAPASS